MIDRKYLKYRQSTRAIIVNKNNKILIINKQNWKEYEWDFPGGGVDQGESPEVTIIRELNEELGLNKLSILNKSKILDKYEWPDDVIIERRQQKNENYRGQKRTQFLVKFNGSNKDLKINTSEIIKYKWIKILDLEKYFVFPNQYQKVKKVLNEFKL
jgi:putative (di)nucleoside polyphosphate hydrolase